MMDAVESPEVSLLRREVPEFEVCFQAELIAEDGELGAFQAVSLLARWVATRLGTPDEAARRTFDAVEQLITNDRFQLGDALAAEFIEAVAGYSGAEALMGARTRERARPAL